MSKARLKYLADRVARLLSDALEMAGKVCIGLLAMLLLTQFWYVFIPTALVALCWDSFVSELDRTPELGVAETIAIDAKARETLQ